VLDFSYMKASDLFVQALEKEGVEYIFGIPGEENLDLLESLRKSKRIQFIITRHEQAAGFMAATVGRLTGKAGVALSTLGPGATNFVTATAFAQLGGMPALFITGQKPIKTSKQGQFQIINSVSIFHPLTKSAHQIISGKNVPIRVRQAFKLAEDERPGAVHLELPEDIAAEEVADPTTLPVEKIRRPVAEDKALRQAADMIRAAKCPAIIVGAGSNRKQVSKMLTQFVEKTGIPVVPTQMGKGGLNEKNELYIGTATLSDHDFIHKAINTADLIINIGHDVVEKPPFIMRPNDTRKVMHINFSPAVIDEIYFPHHEVVGDIANALWCLKEHIEPEPHWDFSAFDTARTETQAHLHKKSGDNAFPLVPQRIVSDVRDMLGDEDIITLDNGMFKLWFSRYYEARGPNTILLDNALASMGAGLPSGIAAKLLHPERHVVVITGDGGFMMNSQELETATRLNLHLTILILNDNGYGMIKWKQHDDGFANFGLEYQNPDFVTYAKSYGANGYCVTKAEDLKTHMQTSLNAGKGVHLIEVPIDYTENEEVFSKELRGTDPY